MECVQVYMVGGKKISNVTAEEMKDKLGSKKDMAGIIKSLFSQLETNLVVLQREKEHQMK